MSWHDPTASTKVLTKSTSVIDTGDRAKTYEIAESVTALGIGGTSDVATVLKGIAKTNDGLTQWGEANNGDGESRKLLDLHDGQGNASDDFVALLREAIEGDDGISLSAFYKQGGDYNLTLQVDGSRSSDLLKFDADYVLDAMTQVAADDPSGVAAALGAMHINNGDRDDGIGVYEFTLANDRESFYWSHDKNWSDDVVGLFDRVGNAFQDEDAVALVNAALEEKFGLADYDGLEFVSNDDGAIVIELRSDRGTTETLVLHGDEIAAALDGFGASLGFGTNLDTKDNKSATAYLDTDDGGSVWWGGHRGKVFFDAAETKSLDSHGGGNKLNVSDVDTFVFNALAHDGANDVDVTFGGAAGDDFMVVELSTNGGNTDTLILEGQAVEAVIADYYDGLVLA
ncbi:hypothetical protein [Jannaschia sp. LMIT008]|uniref:hypothetical protein n=1 Tax=Jannaschia maritima TaxID=3032585 RepID=UPI002811DADC|nr:hypothetical protein [Jannaschia sp. LMIT008]